MFRRKRGKDKKKREKRDGVDSNNWKRYIGGGLALTGASLVAPRLVDNIVSKNNVKLGDAQSNWTKTLNKSWEDEKINPDVYSIQRDKFKKYSDRKRLLKPFEPIASKLNLEIPVGKEKFKLQPYTAGVVGIPTGLLMTSYGYSTDPENKSIQITVNERRGRINPNPSLQQKHRAGKRTSLLGTFF
jgi:hypothetical protein